MQTEFLALSVEGQDFGRVVFCLADSRSFSVCKSSSSALVSISCLTCCLGVENDELINKNNANKRLGGTQGQPLLYTVSVSALDIFISSKIAVKIYCT